MESERVLRTCEPLCLRCVHCYVRGRGDYFYRCSGHGTKKKSGLLSALRYSCKYYEKKEI